MRKSIIEKEEVTGHHLRNSEINRSKRKWHCNQHLLHLLIRTNGFEGNLRNPKYVKH